MGNCISRIVDKKRKLKRKGVIEKVQHPFPLDVAYDILSKLCHKSLFRFKSLSKPWRDVIGEVTYQNLRILLISSEAHILHFNSVNINGSVVTSFIADNSVSEPYLGYLPSKNTRNFPDNNTLKHSIVSVLPSYSTRICFATENEIFLSSTAVRCVLKLPVTSWSSFGFGWLPSIDDDKVVRLFRPSPPESPILKCEVIWRYKTEWNVTTQLCPYDVIEKIDSAFVEGKVNWMISPELSTAKNFILSFDLENEHFATVPAPAGLSAWKLSIKEPIMFTLVELEGRLCMVDHFCGGRRNSTMHIWMLKDYESGVWVKQYKINMEAVSNPDRPLFWWEPWDVMPRFMTGGEMVFSDNSTIYSYNVRTKSWRKILSRKNLPKFGFHSSLRFLCYSCVRGTRAERP